MYILFTNALYNNIQIYNVYKSSKFYIYTEIEMNMSKTFNDF